MSEDFDAQYLYQTENTGPLDTAGHRVISTEPARPSIAGPSPRYTAPASEASAAQLQASQNPQPVRRGLPPPQLTPEQMMAMADSMTQDFLNQRSDMSTAVDPALIRDNGASDLFQPYMDKPDVDRSQSDEYLQDRDALRALRDQQGRFGH